MLDFFRHKGLSNVVYGAIIVTMILAFVITFRPNSTQKVASLSETCVARVRGRCIDPKDFNASLRMIMPSRSAQMSRKMNLKKMTVDGLVERELLIDEAKRLGVTVTDEEVTDQLWAGYVRVSIPAAEPQIENTVLQEMVQSYVRAGLVSQDNAQTLLNARETAIPVDFRDPKTKSFDMKTYERTVRNLSNRSTTEFREGQTRELLAAKMRGVVRDPIRVSDAEAWGEYQRRYSTANVTWIPVKESWAARWAVDVTPADVDAWVKAHQADFDKMFEERKKQDAPKAGHVRHILVKLPYGATEEEKGLALAKISWAAARIKAGEAFAEVAREASEDTGSAMQGGDVGEKTDKFVAPFKAAADALKGGETTAGAVETQFGYHLLEKDDPAKAADVEAAVKKSVARSMYAQAKATDAAKQIATKIDDALRGGKSAEDAIKDVIAPYARDTKTPMLAVLPQPAAADAGGAQAPAAAATPTDKRFDAATDGDKPATQTSSAFNRGGDPFPGLSPDGTARVVGFAFGSKDGDVVSEPVRTADAFVVVQLKQHKIATREEFDKDRESFEQELLRAKRDEALSLYVKRLREQAKDDVKIEPAYVQEAGGADGGMGGAAGEEDEY